MVSEETHTGSDSDSDADEGGAAPDSTAADVWDSLPLADAGGAPAHTLQQRTTARTLGEVCHVPGRSDATTTEGCAPAPNHGCHPTQRRHRPTNR